MAQIWQAYPPFVPTNCMPCHTPWCHASACSHSCQLVREAAQASPDGMIVPHAPGQQRIHHGDQQRLLHSLAAMQQHLAGHHDGGGDAMLLPAGDIRRLFAEAWQRRNSKPQDRTFTQVRARSQAQIAAQTDVESSDVCCLRRGRHVTLHAFMLHVTGNLVAGGSMACSNECMPSATPEGELASAVILWCIFCCTQGQCAMLSSLLTWLCSPARLVAADSLLCLRPPTAAAPAQPRHTA